MNIRIRKRKHDELLLEVAYRKYYDICSLINFFFASWFSHKCLFQLLCDCVSIRSLHLFIVHPNRLFLVWVQMKFRIQIISQEFNMFFPLFLILSVRLFSANYLVLPDFFHFCVYLPVPHLLFLLNIIFLLLASVSFLSFLSALMQI